ncbi:MAG: hypothetical protein J0G30_00120 [Actinomycetales bacterium]|nr:hypothetical protein [Actinomycetales bacterium]
MATEDQHDTIREILDAPRPAPPTRAQFATEELFEDAWFGWQAEALERAELALEQIRGLVDEKAGATGRWVPRDLSAVAMLRAEVARELALPEEHRFYEAAELDRVQRMLDRLNPQVTVGAPGGDTGHFWGPASNAHAYLPPGYYDAIDMATGDPVRLVVAQVAGNVDGTASAAFPLTSPGEQTLDELAVTLAASEQIAPAETVRRVTALVADSGRAVRAVDTPAVDMPGPVLARMAARMGIRASQLTGREAQHIDAADEPGLALGR